MNISYDKLKKEPFSYLLFLAILALIAMFYMFSASIKESKTEQLHDKDVQIQKLDTRVNKTDSINHELYQMLGARRIIDTLNKAK